MGLAWLVVFPPWSDFSTVKAHNFHIMYLYICANTKAAYRNVLSDTQLDYDAVLSGGVRHRKKAAHNGTAVFFGKEQFAAVFVQDIRNIRPKGRLRFAS